MLSLRYNPFSKSLSEFPSDELAILREVTEGWFVDYKSEPLSAKDFGKHLSAFANQFGGWLFIGISEGPNKNLKAGTFPGVPTQDVGKTLTVIRDGVSAHVSPTVYFEQRVIDGPIPNIGLDDGRSIIIILVPEGPNPPYVHSGGRIYRRIADSSDPKAETDRAVLDAMWRKSEGLRTRLRDFVMAPTIALSGQPCCHVYFLEDVSLSQPEYELTLKKFSEAMVPPPGPSMSFKLDNTFSTQDGYVGRHHYTNHPLLELMSLRWWHNGNVRLAIPINAIDRLLVPRFDDPLLEAFLALMGRHRDKYQSILNLDQWLFGLLGLAERYLHLRDTLGSDRPLLGKLFFTNVHSTVPFVGMGSYLANVRQHGMSVVQDVTTICPPGDFDQFLPLIDSKHPDPFTRLCDLIIPLTIGGMRSLGVLCEPDDNDPELWGRELIQAIQRAIDAQLPEG